MSNRPDAVEEKGGAFHSEQAADKGAVLGTVYMQPSNHTILVRRRKVTNESLLEQGCRWFVDNQIGISFNLIALLFLAHACFPSAREYTTRFFKLSYYDPASGEYALGSNDICLVTFCIVFLTALRASCMEYVLAPFAKSQGLVRRKAITRFCEQAWLLIYYFVLWPMGMYIYYNSPYWLNMREMWTNWPNREVTGLMKGYMLAQLSFWMQQILVINIEERRKDHWQMFTHHIVTITLIYTSYCYHQTRVGNVILVLMDIVDIFFPIAKCLRYLGYTTLCDVAFGVFMLSWFLARHVFFMMVCWSVWAHIPEVIPSGCFSGTNANLTGPLPEPTDSIAYMLQPLYNSSGMVCFNSTVKWCFLVVLMFLEGLMVMWFTMIINVALRVVRGQGADDVRSDEESEAEVEQSNGNFKVAGNGGEFVYEEAQPLEEEVGVEAIDFKGWERRSGMRRSTPSSSSGVSLPGHSDRKELLNRIGCEKQVN